MGKQQSNGRKSGSKNAGNNSKKKSSTGISKKQIKAKTKSSKVMLEKLNRETTTDDVNHVVLINNVGSSGTGENANKEEDKLSGLKSLKDLKKDHKSDLETRQAIKESKEKTNQDIAAQLELISGFKF
ncbi:unnamed protein product [[Candida] boidinii]|nr:unnamed protein product [[Candida] boidinii]